MGPWGIPWGIFVLEVLAGPGVLLIAEFILHSGWWKRLTDFYYSWNDKA